MQYTETAGIWEFSGGIDRGKSLGYKTTKIGARKKFRKRVKTMDPVGPGVRAPILTVLSSEDLLLSIPTPNFHSLY